MPPSPSTLPVQKPGACGVVHYPLASGGEGSDCHEEEEPDNNNLLAAAGRSGTRHTLPKRVAANRTPDRGGRAAAHTQPGTDREGNWPSLSYPLIRVSVAGRKQQHQQQPQHGEFIIYGLLLTQRIMSVCDLMRRRRRR